MLSYVLSLSLSLPLRRSMLTTLHSSIFSRSLPQFDSLFVATSFRLWCGSINKMYIFFNIFFSVGINNKQTNNNNNNRSDKKRENEWIDGERGREEGRTESRMHRVKGQIIMNCRWNQAE